MMYDMSQIQCFLAVAEHLSFTKAASALYVSQPVLSRKLATLENELGVVLVNRTKRSVSLTPEGVRFQKFFSEHVNALNELLEDISSSRNREVGTINIGIFEGLDLTEFLREMIYDFRLQYENIHINLDSASPLGLIEGLKSGKYDSLIMLNASLAPILQQQEIHDIQTTPLFEIEKCIIYSKYNPVSQKEKPELADFRDQTLFCLENEQVPAEISTNQKLFDAAGFRPKIRMMTSIDAIFMALLTGEGFAVMDDSVRIFRYQGIQHLLLGDKHTVSLITPGQSKKAGELLRNYLQSKCENAAFDCKPLN